MKQKHTLLLLFAALFLAGAAAQVLATNPEGILNYTIEQTQTRAPQAQGLPITAYGGNITWLHINLVQQTKSWQGFVGNASGEITLDDTASETLYSWNVTNMSGEIYASTNCSIDWTTVAALNDCAVDDPLTGTGADSASNTFTPSSNALTYTILTTTIAAGTACAAWPYVNDLPQSVDFENVILETSNGSNQTIYSAIINGSEPIGFDGEQFDYQMLVPVNQTAGSTTYCLYAEID